MANRESSLMDLDQATSGMTLSEPILDAHNSVLLPGGTVLTDAAIASLRRRGIQKIAVAGTTEPLDAELQAARELMQARLAALFRRGGEQQPTHSLFAYLSRYRLG